MSSMLEQAIVDANALKEAAVKNAEQLIIEKYSDNIKEAVDSLLEQEDEMGMAGQETFDDMEVPSAAVPGEDIFEDACPSDEETVTLDLDGLEAALQAMPEEPDESQEEVATELAPEVPEEEEEMALALEEDRDIEIDDDLIEKLIVDLAPRTSGWAGRPKSELDHEVDLDLARMQDSDFQEENEALLQSLQEELGKVKEERDILTRDKKSLGESIDKYQEATTLLKEKVEELSASNARLLYSNKVLSSASLNERQKRKIVEAISKTETVGEAKVLYETLQSAVGSNPVKRKDPKSLNEAVERRNSVLRARRQKSDGSDLPNPARDRMRKLAGIK